MNNNYALLFLYFDTFFNFPKGRSPVTFFEHVGIIVSHSRASRQDTFFDLLLSVNTYHRTDIHYVLLQSQFCHGYAYIFFASFIIISITFIVSSKLHLQYSNKLQCILFTNKALLNVPVIPVNLSLVLHINCIQGRKALCSPPLFYRKTSSMNW